MPTRSAPTIDELEKAFAAGEGAQAVALVGDDGYLVAEARHRLTEALESAGLETRSWDGGAAGLADELRTGSLFGGGVAWVLEDPEWLVGSGGDGKRRLASLVKSEREGKGDPAKRLVEILVARGAEWDPESPGDARKGLAEWLDETDADSAVRDLLGTVLERAISARLEPPATGDPSEELARALDEIATGNRLLLTLGAFPPKASPATRLLPRFVTLAIELPPGKTKEVLGRMAHLAAKEAEVRIDPAALEMLLARTAPPDSEDRYADRSGEAGSIRRFRGELDKLLASAGPGGVVTTPMVSALVEDASGISIFSLDEHLAGRNVKAAVEFVRKLTGRRRSGGDEALMLLGYLAGSFRKMVALHHALGERGIAEASRLQYNGWKARWLPSVEHLLEKGKSDYPLFKATATAAAYSRGEVEEALERIARIDRSVKSGGAPAAAQLEGFLLAVLPRKESRRAAH